MEHTKIFLADNTRLDSLSNKLRRKRFELFIQFTKSISHRPICILDVGGTIKFWENIGYTDTGEYEITLLNLSKVDTGNYINVKSCAGDTRQMNQFSDGTFDVVFSNSVIEHVGGSKDQKRMANEIQCVGKAYFIQTPNFYFPIEPHFLSPCYQLLSLSIRIVLLRHFKLGWHGQIKDIQKAKDVVTLVRLLKRNELIQLFSKASIYEEKLLGITKSFIVFGGKISALGGDKS